MKEFSPRYRLINILLACFQNMTLGGLLFGWASISGGLLVSSPKEGGPGLTSDYVHMMFVVASFFNMLGPLLLGIVLDMYGPRVCSTVSVLLIACGCLLFGLSEPGHVPLFVPAMCLIAFGGPGAQNAIIHLSNLFPRWKATATAFITGSFQLSFIVFLVFDQLWYFMDWNYTHLFVGYCFVCAINLVVSMYMWPDQPYSFEGQVEVVQEQRQALHPSKVDVEEQLPTPDKHQFLNPIRLPSVFVRKQPTAVIGGETGVVRHQFHKLPTYSDVQPINRDGPPAQAPIDLQQSQHRHGYNSSTTSSNNNSNDGKNDIQRNISRSNDANSTITQKQHLSSIAASVKEGSLNTQLSSTEFINLTIFFVVNSFWANFYIGTFDIQLADSKVLSGDEKLNFARIFTLSITLGVVIIPMVGMLMDMAGFPITSLLVTVSGIIWAVLLLLDSEQNHLLIASFVFYSIYRTSFFTFFFAYLADTLGFRYFGMLAGIIFLLGGVAGMFQYPLAQIGSGTCHHAHANFDSCSHGEWFNINLVMTLMIAAMLYFSYQDYRRRILMKQLLERDVPNNSNGSSGSSSDSGTGSSEVIEEDDRYDDSIELMRSQHEKSMYGTIQ